MTLTKKIASGIFAGVAAAVLMETFQELAYGVFFPKGKATSQPSGKPATVMAADRLSQLFTAHGVPQRLEWISGETVHYAMGAATGGLYMLIKNHLPENTALRGVVYGGLVFVFADELANYALGLTESPFKYPLRSHVYAAASHLVYGGALAAVAA